MTSREVVRRTLEFDHPDRVAVSFGDSDIVDCAYSVESPATEWQQIGEKRWERTDEWGNTWGRIDPTSKGEVVRGVIRDMVDVGDYNGPDYSRPSDYEVVRQTRQAHPDKWLFGTLPGFAFNIARKMRKLEQYLVDIILEPEAIHVLHDRIDESLGHMITNYARAGADAVMFGEDWGTQTALLIHPDLWMQEFYPRFRALCELAHNEGIRVFMHSCGQIEQIVPALIDAGIDLLQFDQPELHGIDTLASHQDRARISFWCPVDIQATLQTGDEERIRAAARAMIDQLWRGRGGFVAGYYGDNESIGVDPMWQQWASDEFVSYGRSK